MYTIYKKIQSEVQKMQKKIFEKFRNVKKSENCDWIKISTQRKSPEDL